MLLAVELLEVSATAAVFSGSVRVDNKLMTTARQLRLAPHETGGTP